jgi:hypothetical protein
MLSLILNVIQMKLLMSRVPSPCLAPLHLGARGFLGVDYKKQVLFHDLLQFMALQDSLRLEEKKEKISRRALLILRGRSTSSKPYGSFYFWESREIGGGNEKH